MVIVPIDPRSPAHVTDSFIKRLLKVAKSIEDHWILCEFAEKTEAEVIVWQTVQAAVINLEKQGLACSFAAPGLYSGRQMCGTDNHAGFFICKERKWFDVQRVAASSVKVPDNVKADGNGNVELLWPTVQLLDDLDEHLKKQSRKK